MEQEFILQQQAKKELLFMTDKLRTNTILTFLQKVLLTDMLVMKNIIS